MKVFADTSALYALLDSDDAFHPPAARAWPSLLESESPPETSDWVVVETAAICQRRIGIDAVRALRDDLLPALTVLSVPAEVRDVALAAVIASERRQVSVVDRASFELMRRRGIERAFGFDPDFRTAGFELMPEASAADSAPAFVDDSPPGPVSEGGER